MRLKLFILLVASDQILKVLAVKFFHPVFNRGIAFGAGEDIPIALIMIAYAILALWIFRNKSGLGEMLLLAGGAGNILDRLIIGNIVDWISLGSLWFNLADAYISFGVLMITLNIASSNLKSQNSKPSSKFKTKNKAFSF